MHPILIEGPAVEPVPLPEMKAYLRIDEDDAAQDELIAGLVKAARLMVEATSRRILIEQRWRVMLDRWPQCRMVVLPLSPLIAIDGIRVSDASEVAIAIPTDAIDADLVSDPPRVTVASAPEPGRARNGIQIDLRAGFGAAAVPATLKLATKILVAHWFENRGDVIGDQIMPPQALVLVAPFQRTRV
ncbi:head-tail connector protein [Microvirga roseola]|uniref:head-tail connector protein n=1 Tax=Microvirga roseola TaxID=2883126 RepID=UPI001E4621AD|nr:head-tail connector protein [Microvirga roseola]